MKGHFGGGCVCDCAPERAQNVVPFFYIVLLGMGGIYEAQEPFALSGRAW